jgi:gluconokinase
VGKYTDAVIVLIMGVVGAGKTTVGRLLAGELGWEFVDADSFHSPSNIEKISLGIPLADADRAPWLKAIREAIIQWITKKQNVVLACSALTRVYRQELDGGGDVKLVYLKGTYETIQRRLDTRQGHFATEKLLASQFAILEEPEDAVVMDVEQSPKEIVREIRRRLGLEGTSS